MLTLPIVFGPFCLARAELNSCERLITWPVKPKTFTVFADPLPQMRGWLTGAQLAPGYRKRSRISQALGDTLKTQ